MKPKLYIIALLLITAANVNAQAPLKGTIEENGSNTRLTNVFIRDINNKQISIADKNGNFSIGTETGHTLVFDSPGYVSDTLYVIDMTPKKIKLATLTIALREVRISSGRQQSNFDPHQEYPEVYEKSKVYVFSPSSWFSKESKDARRLKRYFAVEEQERYIDGVFNRGYVSSLVPLKGQELDDFMTMYRPSYDFLKSNNTASLAAYINDSYKRYKALPPNQRSLQGLTTPTN
jgi:hypothetical protein